MLPFLPFLLYLELWMNPEKRNRPLFCKYYSNLRLTLKPKHQDKFSLQSLSVSEEQPLKTNSSLNSLALVLHYQFLCNFCIPILCNFWHLNLEFDLTIPSTSSRRNKRGESIDYRHKSSESFSRFQHQSFAQQEDCNCFACCFTRGK